MNQSDSSMKLQNNQTKWATKTSIPASIPESMECMNSTNGNPNSTMLSKNGQKVPVNYNDISEIVPNHTSIQQEKDTSLNLIEEKY